MLSGTVKSASSISGWYVNTVVSVLGPGSAIGAGSSAADVTQGGLLE